MRRGPISSDAANGTGVDKIREVFQDLVRASKALEGNPEAEDELCREVSVAAARVLARYSDQDVGGVRKVIAADAPLTEEALKETLKKEIASRLDTFQKELYNQNAFLQTVPAQVINDESFRMWKQVLNHSLADATQQDAQDAIRWINKIAEDKGIQLQDPKAAAGHKLS